MGFPLPLLSPARDRRGFLCPVFLGRRMREIDRPANAKAAQGSALTEIRRPRLLRLDPDLLREMAERTERAKELGGSDQSPRA